MPKSGFEDLLIKTEFDYKRSYLFSPVFLKHAKKEIQHYFSTLINRL
jgi:hypothetical protein